jgi:hypothetical protein|nr:MAG TPA: hypothetical protein [Caudoviricetes sp.]
MSNKVQDLFDKLIEKYNLRAITIEGETWYSVNDLPLGKDAVRKAIQRLEKIRITNISDSTSSPVQNYVENNTKVITISMVTSSHIKNFDKVNNAGERFGNFKMVNYLIMNSRLGAEYKIELIEILDKIRQDGFYVDDNISKEQLNSLQNKVNKLKDRLHYERRRKAYGATQIVKKINIDNLLPSTLFRYLDEYLNLGDYTIINKNRRFRPNDNFVNKCADLGVARIGVNNNIIFFSEFAEQVNKNKDILNILKIINKEELQIREKGIENRIK